MSLRLPIARREGSRITNAVVSRESLVWIRAVHRGVGRGVRGLVHTMIAGAVGMELVLLVVAADEGVRA